MKSAIGKKLALYEARWIILVLLVIWRLSWGMGSLVAALPIGLLGFVFYFFRDPMRKIPSDPNGIVSPADGLVSAVEQVDCADIAGGRGWRISIFLSVLDVHVNRAPLAGQIERSEYRPGCFLDARKPEAADRNACRTWIIQTQWGKVVVRQITGAIARRIVAWSRVGDVVEKGEKIGMIRFGSRTELILPLEANVLIKVGEKVQAGTTMVARWKEI